MSDRLKKLQIKKLIQEYNFIQSDFDFKNQVIEDNKQEFINKVSEVEKELNIKKELPINTGNTKNKITSNIQDVSENTKNKIKKIYREIVKLTHPDKADSDKFIELYQKSTKCSEENDLLCLYLISIELNIDFEFDSEDIEFLERIVNLKRKENSVLETSCVWAWINSTNEETKNRLLKFYVINNK